MKNEILLPESDNPLIIEAARIIEKDIPIALKKYELDDAMKAISNQEYAGMVVGIDYTTADVLRSGFRNVPMQSERKCISSFFILENEHERLIFADCAVNPNPSVEQLIDISIATAESARQLGIEPRLALLSFSTHGSSDEKHTRNITKAAHILLNEMKLDFIIDGEVQFDAAYNQRIAKKKTPNSPFAQEPANVFIFPDLNSGNIAYKITQQLGGYQAIGPILQGFKYPINDLSRGASVEEIVKVIELTFMQTNRNKLEKVLLPLV
jgi:phosphate acetyltransferase